MKLFKNLKNLKTLLTVFLFTIIGHLSAQTIISGIVTDNCNKPIPFANVYILKTTIETTTDKDGKYILEITKNGNYQLFASSIGFESNGININARGGKQAFLLQLSLSSIKLSETEIKASNEYKKKYYEFFLKLFLGESAYASHCKIMNPNDLYLNMDNETILIKGFSIRPLRIENRELGYTMIYDLKYFTFNPDSRVIKFAGDYYFMPYKGKKRKIKQWNHNRQLAYIGSRMHFIRSLYSDSIEKEHFEIYESDSINNATRISYLKSVNYHDIITPHDETSKTFYSKNPLTVAYVERGRKLINVPSEYETDTYKTKLVFTDSIQIFQNGSFEPSLALKWEGEMSYARVADMLPFDYEPPDINKSKLRFQSKKPTKKDNRKGWGMDY